MATIHDIMPVNRRTISKLRLLQDIMKNVNLLSQALEDEISALLDGKLPSIDE